MWSLGSNQFRHQAETEAGFTSYIKCGRREDLMTQPADLLLTNATVHTLAAPPASHAGIVGNAAAFDVVYDDGGVAIRDGRIVRVGASYEVDFLNGTTTQVIDCDGRVLLPGFVDAHTHMEVAGRRLVHAELAGASSRTEVLGRLETEAETSSGWIQGYGYDESEWGDSEQLTRTELDTVSESRPVVAFREDLHTASINGVALAVLGLSAGDSNVHEENGRATGVVTEGAVNRVNEAIAPDTATTRKRLIAARDHAHQLGITGVHDMVRGGHAAKVYRQLDLESALELRVRINYWTDHLEAAGEVGLQTNAGSEFVRTGAIKSFTDGAIGSRTARLSQPYDDGPDGNHGEWVVDPEKLREWVERATDAGFQCTAHAIGDSAVRETLETYASTDDPGVSRHRIEHLEVLDKALIERFATVGVVASVQPNFHKWAHAGGLYEARLGEQRAEKTSPLGRLVESEIPLAFGSDGMPMGPLYGVEQAVTAPSVHQRLSVTEALAAYTRGAAYAGFDESRMGTLEPGKLADCVVLEQSPWDVAKDAIADIGVWATVVDGRVVHRA
jgi:predicted amidohydrolase YtcJ